MSSVPTSVCCRLQCTLVGWFLTVLSYGVSVMKHWALNVGAWSRKPSLEVDCSRSNAWLGVTNESLHGIFTPAVFTYIQVELWYKYIPVNNPKTKPGMDFRRMHFNRQQTISQSCSGTGQRTDANGCKTKDFEDWISRLISCGRSDLRPPVRHCGCDTTSTTETLAWTEDSFAVSDNYLSSELPPLVRHSRCDTNSAACPTLAWIKSQMQIIPTWRPRLKTAGHLQEVAQPRLFSN